MTRLMPSIDRLSRHERSVLVGTCLSSLGSFYTMSVTSFALPQIQRGLSIAEDEIGTIFALIRFGALFSLALGMLADRLGRRRLLIASVAGCALCNLATASASSGLALAGWQLGARFFVGGQILLAGVVVSEELSAENRGLGLGLLSALGGLGGALTLLVYSFVDFLPYGWRFLFVVGGFGLLIVPWLWRRLDETRRFAERRDHQRPAGVPQSSSASARTLVGRYAWRWGALLAIVLPVQVILEPGSVFVSKHMQDDLGYSPPEVGLMVALCGIATPLGSLFSGTVSDRFGRKPVTIMMSLLLSVAMAIFYNGPGTPYLVTGLTLVFASLGGLIVLQTALAAELFPTELRSTAAGVREAVSTVGASLGLWALSALYVSTHSHAQSITWLLVLTPIAPLALLLVPETARRDLEEIAPGGRAGPPGRGGGLGGA